MRLLGEFFEQDVDMPGAVDVDIRYKLRKAARAVVFGPQGKVAVMYVEERDCHKLPGRGIRKGEKVGAALERGVKGQTGRQIELRKDSVGAIIEYRDSHKIIQITYCCLADATGEEENPDLTEEENAHGFQLKWIEIDETIEALEKDSPSDYVGHFIRKRDLLFLKKAKKILG